jgi:hypothetical protein
MERIKTIFCSSEKSGVNYEMQCFKNTQNEIYIQIKNPEDEREEFMFICLDKKTAVKFSKLLRREISYIESEVSDEESN